MNVSFYWSVRVWCVAEVDDGLQCYGNTVISTGDSHFRFQQSLIKWPTCMRVNMCKHKDKTLHIEKFNWIKMMHFLWKIISLWDLWKYTDFSHKIYMLGLDSGSCLKLACRTCREVKKNVIFLLNLCSSVCGCHYQLNLLLDLFMWVEQRYLFMLL